MAEQNKSIGWLVGMLALTVAFFGWGFLAADFFQNDPEGGAGRTDFFVNAIVQLPNFGRVMGHAFKNLLWVVVVIVVLEVGVVGFGFILKNIERELNRK